MFPPPPPPTPDSVGETLMLLSGDAVIEIVEVEDDLTEEVEDFPIDEGGGGGGGINCGGEECGEGNEVVSVAGEPVDTKPESSPEDNA